MSKIAKTLMAASLAVALGAGAQNVETPYSMYGYGIMGDRATSMQRQMGSIGVAMNSGRQVNVMNPASYAATDSLTFLFDLGADLSFLWSKEAGNSDQTTGGGVDYVTMQFPIGKHFGGSFGLIPYSSVGYAFGNNVKHGVMSNNGSGGINELYLGLSGRIKGFSLGFNVSYDFGNIINDVYADPDVSSITNTRFEHLMEVRDWNIVIGAQYTFKPDRYSKLVAGVTYSPKKTFLGKASLTKQLESVDTLQTISSCKLKDRYYQPHSVGAGLSYTYNKAYHLMVEFDFQWQGWKDCQYSPMYSNTRPEEVVFSGMTFNNRTRYALGAEFVPKVRGSYMQRVNYRLGGYYCNDYLNINGNGVREYGVSGGFGFPTPEGKTMINFGLEWKHRQGHPQSLVTENYFNITLGVNFNEVWFFKRKIK